MVRKGIDFIALFYFATALICFVPYFQFGHPVLIAAGLFYAIPSFVTGGGVALRREWGRKLAMVLSPLLILVVLPLLFKKQLTFVFSLPFRIAMTYPPSSVLSFKGLFGALIIGHLVSVLYLLRGPVKGAFQQGSAGEGARKQESGELDLGEKKGPAARS